MTARSNEHLSSRVLRGKNLAPGVAVGTAFVYGDTFYADPDTHAITKDGVSRELSRLEAAIEAVLQNLRQGVEHIKHELHAELAAIFRMHQAVLRDPALMDEFRAELNKELVNAEQTVRRVFSRR